MLGKRLPSLDHRALFVVLDNRPAGALLDVWEDQAGIRLVAPPDLEAPGDAACDQGTAGFKLGIPCVLDQDGAQSCIE